MINITLKDGSVKQYSEETSVISIAKDISEGLARNVISANFNDKVVEVNSCLLYTSPSPRDRTRSRMPSSA